MPEDRGSTRPTVRVRVAYEADIEEMHRVRMSVRENRLLDPTRVQPEDYRYILYDRGRGWVAEEDGAILGFAIADLTSSSIWALFVEPAEEGRGIGRRLHATAVDWLFHAGAKRLWLTTDPGTRAERFYQLSGWRQAGLQRGEARYEMTSEEWRSVRGASSAARAP